MHQAAAVPGREGLALWAVETPGVPVPCVRNQGSPGWAPPQNPGLPTRVLFPAIGTSRSYEAAQRSALGFLSGRALLVLLVLLEKWGCYAHGPGLLGS